MTSFHTRAIAGLFGVALTCLAAEAHDRITTRITWRREIAPIFRARCTGCHASRPHDAPALTTYAEARPWAVAIKEEVLTRRMPRWSAARGYGDFANDPSLSPFEIALVAAWVDGGAPETDPTRGGSPEDTRDPVMTPAFNPPAAASVVTLSCGDQPLAGRLLAVRPRLARGTSAGIAVMLPGNRQEIVAWIRDYDPEFAPAYWLRTPIDLPRGSRLMVEPSPECAVDATLAR
jgi:hypothetical protein